MKIKDTGQGIQIYDFNSVESFKIARKLEEDGINYYSKLLGSMKDSRVREVLLYLLGEEKEHLKIFEEMLRHEDPEALDEREGEIVDSLDTGVFAFPKDEEVASDFDKTLQLGIALEKRSLTFYLEVVKYTESEEGKGALKKIIAEEKRHWEELKNLTQ
jgi:rubrerythrin